MTNRARAQVAGMGQYMPARRRGGQNKKGVDYMTINLDRFSQGLPDPAEAEVVAHCAACGCEIYVGEMVYKVDGEIVCDNWECVIEKIDCEFVPAEEAVMPE